jgi:alkylmercury lyase
MTARSPSLSSLADGLADTFPAAQDAPLARALLALVARGDPVTDERLAAEINRAPGEVHAVLARWPNVHRDARGAVVAFSGLSLQPTEHRFHAGDRELFTWCAWDTLFMPSLLDEPAEIRSTCPLTGTAVHVRVDARGIVDAEPADLWVSFPPIATTSIADIVESFCCRVHFLARHETAQRWLGDHPGGFVLDLRDAYEVGQRATARLRTAKAAHA